jgi:hypothetical protein
MQALGEFLVSGETTAILVVIIGGLFAQWIASRWQQRAKRWEIQYQIFDEINDIFWKACDVLSPENRVGTLDDLDRAINSMRPLSFKADMFFPDSELATIWNHIMIDLTEALEKARAAAASGEEYDFSADPLEQSLYSRADEALHRMSRHMGLGYSGFRTSKPAKWDAASSSAGSEQPN